MGDLWHGLPATAQDALTLAALLALPVLIALVLLRGFAPWPLIRALLWRFRWANALCLALIAVSIGMGVGVITQERGLRDGSASAADKFDIVITAPGSETTMMLATVYLQITDAPLLDGATYAEVAEHPRVRLAAPLAYGDTFDGAPIVGTTAAFVDHLAEGRIEGAHWSGAFDAIAGARVPLSIGATFSPAHGTGDGADDDAHDDTYTIVGRMAPTGSPWDHAILVPVEAVWRTHGLADGHAPENEGQLGPPFDARFFPGTPAIVVVPVSLGAAYQVRQAFTREKETMAFFPGAVLSELYRLMGDVRRAMSLLALVTQALVAASVLLSLFILTRLFARQTAVLRALGAPDRFVLATVWSYAMALLLSGAVLGLGFGQGAALLLSRLIAARTDLAIPARLGWTELHLAAGFVALASVLALLPALATLRRPVVDSLRGS
ncbi:FtsX-like permease family protein [Pseudaestuariivita atlantica]|uniref:ABC3 transporter permease C-terminal domain-containing protein n=1 Tax=Pseudaestuariivita atlantica TaxID=1317121 RepID=A0A0L1JSW6_9RHOB|nr:ABC transporter permease [Pseudaestuariivita atlantica]KNG94845.1 hypothetical protein ATO11_05525 [Pseudaestuariivita atlantica]